MSKMFRCSPALQLVGFSAVGPVHGEWGVAPWVRSKVSGVLHCGAGPW